MTDSNPDIDAICRELYEKHQDAWKAIRRRLPSQRDEYHANIGARVSKRLEEKHGGEWLFTVRRDKYVCVFRSGWSVLGSYESESIVGLVDSSEPVTEYPKIHFRLVADRSDADADEQFRYEYG